MGQPDSSYKTTRILPKLDQSTIQRPWDWSLQFWIFWQSATRLAPTIQLVLVHMDEKWFYEIVLRRNVKYVPFFGIELVDHSIQHKSHIGKQMVVASTYFLPVNNNMGKGGHAFLGSLVRVGKMLPAKRDTYMRVYRDDGTYHYPKNDNNILR
jgi:hypothetical protein